MKHLLRKISALLIALALVPAATAWAAVPPQPTYGTAVVDGTYAEWDLTGDFFANMYRAGDLSKKLESKLYLRYDCDTHTVYALVLMEDSIPAVIDPSNKAWIAIDTQSNKVVQSDSGNNGTPPDFAWIGVNFDGNSTHAQGYEALVHAGSRHLRDHRARLHL